LSGTGDWRFHRIKKYLKNRGSSGFQLSGEKIAKWEDLHIPEGNEMLFSLERSNRETLSRRSRVFIRIHHLAVVGLIAWIGYLFALRELL
jgi:hypothetical protein